MTSETVCAQCGVKFQAQRGARKYCSGRCRTAAYRGRPAAAPAPALAALPSITPTPPSAEPGELLRAVLAETATCQAPGAAAQALNLARAIESGPPAHALAGLHRALAAARAEVLRAAPVEVESDPIDLIRHRRDLLRSVWRDHAEGLLSAREADLKEAAIREALTLVTPKRERPLAAAE